MRNPLLRFLCLHEAVTLPFVVAIFWPKLTFCDHPFALRRLPQWNFVLLTVKCHGVSPLSTAVGARFIAREDPHSKCIKCLGFSHARDAVYGTSKCKIYEDFRLITLRSRLEACEKESSISPRRAPGTSVASHEFAASREASASHEATTWGPDVELAEVKSEQTGLTFSLPSACVQIHQLNLCMIFYFLARGHVIPFAPQKGALRRWSPGHAPFPY